MLAECALLFAAHDGRRCRDGEALIEDVLSTNDATYWLDLFDEALIPAGLVQNVGEALEHEQSRAIRMVVDVDAPGGGTKRALGLPILFNGTTRLATSAPPKVGQYSVEFLHEFNFSDPKSRRCWHLGQSCKRMSKPLAPQ